MNAFDKIISAIKNKELDASPPGRCAPYIELDQVDVINQTPGCREVEFALSGVDADVVSTKGMSEILGTLVGQSSRVLHSYCDFEHGLSENDTYHQLIGIIDSDAPEKSWVFSMSASIDGDTNANGGATAFCRLVEGYEASLRVYNESRADEISAAAQNTIGRLGYLLNKDKDGAPSSLVEFMERLKKDSRVSQHLSQWLAMELGTRLDDATPPAPTSKPRAPGRL